MSITKNWITATAAVLAMATPFIGSAEARPDRFHNTKQVELRGDGIQLIVNRRGGRHFDRVGSVYTPRINHRIQNQMRRIARGRDTGRLSRISAVRLRGRVFAIQTALKFAKIDGHVSRGERVRLLNMLDANSDRIRRHARFGNRRFR